MRGWRVLPIVATVLATAGGLSCGGNSLDKPLANLVESDLAIMVLPEEELGEEYTGFEVSSDSGVVDNAEKADDSIDEDDSAADFSEAGRITGYELSYEAPGFAPFEEGRGVFVLGTGVDLYEDDQAAAAGLEQDISDLETAEGKEETGVRFEEVERFGVTGLGDEAQGVRFRARLLGEQQVGGTGVFFQLGRLVGSALLGRADDVDSRNEVERIATLLEERMRGVLAGDIEATPVPIPTDVVEEGVVATPPQEIPDLEGMAPTLAGLPSGASVESQGYVESETAIASYDRAFDVVDLTLGSSKLVSLDVEVELYSTAEEAGFYMSTFEVLVGSDAGRQLLARAISQEGGFDPDNVEFKALPAPDIGDAAAAYQADVGSPIGGFAAVYVLVRVDGVLATVIGTGPAGQLHADDIIRIARVTAERMRAGLPTEP